MNTTLPPPPSGATSLNLRSERTGQPLAARVVRCPQPALGCVVLLHGLASNRTRWSELMETTTLGARWHLLAPDLRGHGESQPAGKSTLEDWCDDLAELLKAVEASGLGRIVLVGHSLGAQVALHFVEHHPQRVASLVLIDPVFRTALAPRWARIARAAPLFRVAAAAVRGLNAAGLRRARVGPDDLRALDTLAREALRDPASEAAFVHRYSSTRADLRQFRTAQYLQDLVEMFRPTPALDRICTGTDLIPVPTSWVPA